MTTTKQIMERRAKEITDEWIRLHAKAMKAGNFSYANFIRSKLEAFGETGDFESTFDPEPVK